MDSDSFQSCTSIQDAVVLRCTAIVAEGGGQRGMYTAGVLDAFLSAGFNPFEIGVGASAGAQNLTTYFLSLPGYAKRAIAELTAAPNFAVPYRWLGNRSVLDLDTYFSQLIEDPEFSFPCGKLDRLVGHRQLVFAATSLTNLSATYLEPDSSSLLTHLKASSAVPFLYKGGVPVGNEILVDGGVADPIPVRQAHALGATRIVVVRTVPVSDTVSCWRQRLKTFRLDRAMPTIMSEMLDRHEQAYADALRFIAGPPPGVELLQIAPEKPLRSHVFGSRSDALLADYASGCRAGNAALERLHQWVGSTQEALSQRAAIASFPET